MNLSYKELMEESRPEKGLDILSTYWRDKEKGVKIPKGEKEMSKVERMLVVGTFGICTGVWVTLGYLVYINSF